MMDPSTPSSARGGRIPELYRYAGSPRFNFEASSPTTLPRGTMLASPSMASKISGDGLKEGNDITEQASQFQLLTNFDWLPNGFELIRECYERELKKMGEILGQTVQLSYDANTHCFTLLITNIEESAEIYMAFHVIIRAIVAQETQDIDREDPLESNLIRRIGGPTLNRIPMVAELYPKEVCWYSSKRIWLCNDKAKRMTLIVPKLIIDEITNVTACTLVVDLNEQCIFIGGRDDIVVDLVVDKLDNVRKYWMKRDRLKEVKKEHLFYAEETPDHLWRVTLSAITQIKKVAIGTLFDQIHFPPALFYDTTYVWLQWMKSVRFCKVQQTTDYALVELPRRPKAVISAAATASQSPVWSGYQYTGRGQPLDIIEDNGTIDIVKRFDLNVDHNENTNTRVKSWINEVESSTDKLAYGVPMMALEITDDEASKVDDLSLHHASRKTFTSEVDTRHLYAPVQRQESRAFQDQTIYGQAPNMKGNATESLLDSHDPEAQALSMPLTPLPRTTLNFAPTTIQKTHDVGISQPPQVTRQYDFFNLLEDEGDQVREVIALKPMRVSENSEVASRVFHNTMNQRGPKPSRGSYRGKKPNFTKSYPPRVPQARVVVKQNDPQMSFLKDTNTEISQILDCMRDWNGDCILEAKVGRILLGRVPAIYVALEGDLSAKQHAPYGDDESGSMAEMLRKRSDNILKQFTAVITTLPAEAQFIIEQKAQGGKDMWHSRIGTLPGPTWNVTYEIVAVNELDRETIWIKIDPESFECRAFHSPIEFGSIMIHALKRNWDVRIEAYGSKIRTDGKYDWLLEDIKKYAYVKPNQKEFQFEFMYNYSKVHEHINVKSIRAYRKCNYPSADLMSTLHVTEIHRLNLDQVETHNKNDTMMIVRGVPAIPIPGYERMWYEMSVSSNAMNAAFKANKHVDIGEEANWTAEQFTKECAIEAMYRPALMMVRGMDGVGFYNDNGLKFNNETEVPASGAYSTDRSAFYEPEKQESGYWEGHSL